MHNHTLNNSQGNDSYDNKTLADWINKILENLGKK
jgi:hypothetical protein